jgi:hypothetical protein
MITTLFLAIGLVNAQEIGQCSDATATSAFQAGFQAQKSLDTATALREYQACLKAEPNCIPCLYEIGWTHWTPGKK